jgi:nucleoside 2-deoxyribosyltransferase
MSYFAKVYRVLIASPSDLQEEREAISQVIQKWNLNNATQRRIILEPVKWESHSFPELGDRPQAVVNRQIVSDCDILIAIFWNRLGSPTGVTESGTQEEIELFLSLGKPVMLYFSETQISPEKIDVRQYQRLNKFKEKYKKLGIIWTYNSISKFIELLYDQLNLRIWNLPKKSLLFDDSGIYSALPMWAGKIDDEFMLTQNEILILLKDGYTFFGTKKDVLKPGETHQKLYLMTNESV